MKKIFFVLLLLTNTAMAHGYGYRGGGLFWAVPIISGIIGYQIGQTNSEKKENERNTQNSQTQVQQNCTPWTETQTPDGKITRTRTCSQ